MKTTITLEGMKFRAFHGVYEQERVIGGDYTVDVQYDVDTSASETDALADVVSYADVFLTVKGEMSQPSQLLEHVAARILRRLKAIYPTISNITVTVAKLHPPVAGEASRAAVTVSA